MSLRQVHMYVISVSKTEVEILGVEIGFVPWTS